MCLSYAECWRLNCEQKADRNSDFGLLKEQQGRETDHENENKVKTALSAMKKMFMVL